MDPYTINKALWAEADVYAKPLYKGDRLAAWQSAFRCWLRSQMLDLERELTARTQ